jgi:hypothetical protein
VTRSLDHCHPRSATTTGAKIFASGLLLTGSNIILLTLNFSLYFPLFSLRSPLHASFFPIAGSLATPLSLFSRSEGATARGGGFLPLVVLFGKAWRHFATNSILVGYASGVILHSSLRRLQQQPVLAAAFRPFRLLSPASPRRLVASGAQTGATTTGLSQYPLEGERLYNTDAIAALGIERSNNGFFSLSLYSNSQLAPDSVVPLRTRQILPFSFYLRTSPRYLTVHNTRTRYSTTSHQLSSSISTINYQLRRN